MSESNGAIYKNAVHSQVLRANAEYSQHFGDRHPHVSPTIPIYGYIYDVRSGKLIEVPKANEAGA